MDGILETGSGILHVVVFAWGFFLSVFREKKGMKCLQTG